MDSLKVQFSLSGLIRLGQILYPNPFLADSGTAIYGTPFPGQYRLKFENFRKVRIFHDGSKRDVSGHLVDTSCD